MVLLLAACHPLETTIPSDSGALPTAETGAVGTDPDAPKLSALQTTLFSRSCAIGTCHTAASRAGDLSLEEGDTWWELVNVRSSEIEQAYRVVPGAAVNSYLVLKLEAAAGIEGVPMPFGSRLYPTEITPVKTWIDAGALDN
jgi:hypothetical protein